MSESGKEFWNGVRAEFPLLVGVFPFGMIYGALALNAGLSALASQLMSAMVNVRHMLYSASLAPYLKDLSLKWKAVLSYFLTDEAYAPSILKYEKEGVTPMGHWFVLGAGFSLWFIWQVSTALGIFLGTAIPKSWSLDFALPLTFIAMVVPALKNRPMIAAALSAGLVALLAYTLPFKLGLILAALTGIVVGTIMEDKKSPGGAL
jgi:predicted branched-subunit amino acid permease